jgi:hypothetical protein
MTERIKMNKVISALLILLAIGGCSTSTVRTAFAMMQTTDNFKLYSEKDAFIFQQTELPLTARVEKYLPHAVDVVEREQFQKSNASFHLSRRTFYRQAASFVQFLHDADTSAFKNLLLYIQDEKPFSASFQKCYGVTIAAKWDEFIAREKI